MPEWVTTSEILSALRDFSDDALWTAFTTRFRPALIGFGRRAGLSESDAEDAAQATFMSFAESYRRGAYDRSKGRLTSWLFSIAQRRISDGLRSLVRRSPEQGESVAGDLAALSDPDEAPDAWKDTWESVLMELCLAHVRREVKPSTFRAFELVALREVTPADAAAELGMTKNAVVIAKFRVMKRLREMRVDLDGDIDS